MCQINTGKLLKTYHIDLYVFSETGQDFKLRFFKHYLGADPMRSLVGYLEVVGK